MVNHPQNSALFSFPDLETPIGRVHFGGFLPNSAGTGLRGFRTYGMYAAVLILNGRGIYRDANRSEFSLIPGSAILVFPELAHHYGPRPGERWDEMFVAFSGAAFDAWRAHGLDPAHPVWNLNDAAAEAKRLRNLLAQSVNGLGDAIALAAKVHQLLEIWLSQRLQSRLPPAWLERARRRLATSQDARNLNEIAAESGLHIDAFRRAFRKSTGETPSRFRQRHRLSLATEMLRRKNLKLSQIAETLGFHDAFHFSKQFKQHFGISPALYRESPPSASGKILRPIEEPSAVDNLR